MGYILTNPVDVAKTAVVKIGVGTIGWKTTESFWSARNVVSWLSNFLLLALAAAGAGMIRLCAGPRQRVLWLCVAGVELLVHFTFLSARRSGCAIASAWSRCCGSWRPAA